MPLIRWNEEFSVNIMEIDKQHQKLIEMINNLHDAMKQGKAKDILGKILDEMVGYAGTHFKTEEKYFDQFKYPETEEHKKEHINFVKEVTEFKKKFEAGQQTLSIQVMNFLSNWLKKHIKDVDKRYGPFLNSKGIK